MKCTKNTIWSFKQNKPSLIVEDIVHKYPEVDPDFVYTVLLKRGVFKWFSVRRDLIKLKNLWKKEVQALNCKKSIEEKGYYKALLKYRSDIKKLCHSERWVAPDFDKEATIFLKQKEYGRSNDNRLSKVYKKKYSNGRKGQARNRRYFFKFSDLSCLWRNNKIKK